MWRAGAVVTYRFDLHDGCGVLIGRRSYSLRNDDDAIKFAARVLHPHGIKVWDGKRLVVALRPGAAASRPSRR